MSVDEHLSAFAIRRLLSNSTATPQQLINSHVVDGNLLDRPHNHVELVHSDSIKLSNVVKWRKASRISIGDDGVVESRVGAYSNSPERHDSRTESLQRQLCSTFMPSVNNVLEDTERAWTITLENSETVTLVGQYDLWVRSGTITVLGAILRASSTVHRIYAPSTHPLPVITHLLDPYDSVYQHAEVTLISCNTHIRSLQYLSPKLSCIWNHPESDQYALPPFNKSVSRRSFRYLQSLSDDPYQRVPNVVQNHMSWQTSIAKLGETNGTQTRAVLVAGPKGSGKSTFVQLLINSLISKPGACGNSGIALLDLDPSQPKFLPPGEISLLHVRSCIFSPSFTHPAPNSRAGYQLIKSHHIGCITPKEDPDHYIQIALDLIKCYRLLLIAHPSCPLIIDSYGWVLGNGLEILTQLIQSAYLTDLIYMSTTGPEDVIETLGEVAEEAQLMYHVLDSRSDIGGIGPAADLRLMQTLSYFHLDGDSGKAFQWNSTPLPSRDPLELVYGGAEQSISGIVIIVGGIDSRCVHDLILGSVLGVVVVRDESEIDDQWFLFDELTPELIHDHRVDAGLLDEDMAFRISDGSLSGTRENWSQESAPLHMQLQSLSASSNVPSILRETDGHRPQLRHTVDGLPYMFVNGGSSFPFALSRSRSIGQVLVHDIDSERKLLRVSTPLTRNALQLPPNSHAQIFLVRARLETPTWAYAETSEFNCGKEMRPRVGRLKKSPARCRTHNSNSRSGECSFDSKAWGINLPWIAIPHKRNLKQRRDKIWRSRRNLQTRENALNGEGSP